MIRVLHLIHEVSLGGACRALLATAKYSAVAGGYEHAVASLRPPQPDAAALAQASGVRVVTTTTRAELLAEIERADVFLIHWWNHPEMMRFLSEPLPACRLAIFYHVAGNTVPHIITRELIEFADFNIPCSPYSYLEQKVFQEMDPSERLEKVRMIYGAADFDRLKGLQLKPHEGFNIGFIGSVDFVKIHRRYVRMSLDIRVPESRFLICGGGDAVAPLTAEARAAGQGGRFHFFGIVPDIRPVLEVTDVYGYPLCEDTYAASELNLQEVMYAGIPPVVFPYGGVRCLVVHDYTGLIVHSEREYAEAIEFLYHHPEERQRLGSNAAEYARQIFGAGNAAQKLNSVLSQLMTKPKRTRPAWGGTNSREAGFDLLLRSLGEFSGPFGLSRYSPITDEALQADWEIARCSTLAARSAIDAYKASFPRDAWLNFWAALVAARNGRHDRAVVEYTEAIQNGFPELRIYWHLARSAEGLGRKDLADQMRSLLRARDPILLESLDQMAGVLEEL